MSDAPDLQHPSRFAATAPDRPAVIMGSGEVLTYGELEDRSCRVANLLRSVGCDTGSHVAVLVENRLEYFEVIWAGLRAGLYVTPINWHLAAGEAAYIVDDCGASRAWWRRPRWARSSRACRVESATLAHRFAGRGQLPGYEDYDAAVAAQPTTPAADECEGKWMFYSSGTTGARRASSRRRSVARWVCRWAS